MAKIVPSLPLGKYSVAEFLNEYWQQKPCLIEQAYPDFKTIISADQLAGLACEPDVEARIVKYDAQRDWQLLNGPFDEVTFSTLPDSHWTLLVQAVDLWLPEAQAMLEDFNFLPRWRRDDLMISYATKGGGVGAHYDHYDVFLLQASGQRRWEVGGDYNDQSPRKKDSPLLHLADWQAEQAWTLNPGDMLYIPPGLGHNGIAFDDDCMTYSIGFRAPSHTEILCGITDLASEQLASDLRFKDAPLHEGLNPGEINASDIDQLSQLISALADDRTLLSRWLGQTVTAPKYAGLAPIETPSNVHDTKQLIAQATHLKHTAGTRMAYYKNEDQTLLFVNEHTLLISKQQQALTAKLCASNIIATAVIGTHEHHLELIATLLGSGALQAEK